VAVTLSLANTHGSVRWIYRMYLPRSGPRIAHGVEKQAFRKETEFPDQGRSLAIRSSGHWPTIFARYRVG